MTRLAIGAMVSFVCKRGLRSHRQATDDGEAGSSSRPWTSTRMPAIMMVLEETGRSDEFCVPWRGFVVAAMVGWEQ